MFKRFVTLAGRTIHVREVFSGKGGNRKRSKKEGPTSDAVKKVNIRIALRDLIIKFNANFGPGDYHVILTYDGKEEITRELATVRLKKFKRKIRTWCRKNNVPFKSIDVNGPGRIHHHLVLNKIPVEVINEAWEYGFVRVVPLDDSGEYSALAHYFLIENAIPVAEAGDNRKRKYNCSRSIITPQPREEEISYPLKDGEVKVPKEFARDYYLSADTFQAYEHAVLGVTCVEYILIRKDELPAQKKLYRGKEAKHEKFHKEPLNEQLEFFSEWR